MADEEVVNEEVVKSPQEIAKEKHEAEEARLKAQIPFDPKVHGVGTTPVQEPQSVKELYKAFAALEARVRVLEQDVLGL